VFRHGGKFRKDDLKAVVVACYQTAGRLRKDRPFWPFHTSDSETLLVFRSRARCGSQFAELFTDKARRLLRELCLYYLNGIPFHRTKTPTRDTVSPYWGIPFHRE
jgi:hypothetical protein